MSLNQEAVTQALKAVIDPNTGKDLVSSRCIKNLSVSGADVRFDVELGYPAKSQHEAIRALAGASDDAFDEQAIYCSIPREPRSVVELTIVSDYRRCLVAAGILAVVTTGNRRAPATYRLAINE